MTLANRLAYGETLIELAKENPNIVVLDADVSGSTGIRQVKEALPDRFITVGIAEQNMMGIAAGMASCGKIAFATTFGVFASMRAVEQVRNAICYTKLNVKIAGTHAGIETGPDGATHQAIEDMAIIRSIPNIKLLVPSTPNATRKLTRVAAALDGPVYLRFGKNPAEEFYAEDEEFPLGGSKQLRDGRDATIIACGSMLGVALMAADDLAKRRTGVRVIDMYSIKPIDEAAIIRAATETAGIVTIEDHNVIGGLGGAVCEVTATRCPTRVIRIGLQDVFGHSGDFAGLCVLYGLTPEKLIEAVGVLAASSQ
jgi:transketolase